MSDSDSDDEPLYETVAKQAEEIEKFKELLLQNQGMILGNVAITGDYPYEMKSDLEEAISKGRENSRPAETARLKIRNAFEQVFYEQERRARGQS